MYNKRLTDQMKIVEIDEELLRLAGVVLQAVEDFMKKKGTTPVRLFLNNSDFNLKGEVEVCGYKVMATELVPKGEVIVMDNTPKTMFDLF